MIVLRRPPIVEMSATGGWVLIFWIGESFDYSIPFRSILNDISETLSETASVDLQLPDYEKDEDFITGSLTFQDSKIDIYFEYSLAHLDFSSSNREALISLKENLKSEIVVE